MKELIIPATHSDPHLKTNRIGKITIEGYFLTYEFDWDTYYVKPLMSWLKNYEKTEIVIDIKLEYISTNNVKNLINLFREIKTQGVQQLRVNWYYHNDDEDMKTLGSDIEKQSESELIYLVYAR